MSEHTHPARAPLPPIRFKELADALLARIDTLVPFWLPGGTPSGHEYVCGSLQGGAGSSCSVNLTTGQWADFAADEKGGDLVSLYAAINGLGMGKAALQVARDEGLEDVAGVQPDAGHQRVERPTAPAPKARAPRSDEGWQTVRPVPAYAPAPTFKHFSRPATDLVRTSVYQVGDELMGFVVRFKTSDGGKDDMPYTWTQSTTDGACKWSWKQFDEPRPLYLPARVLPAPEQTVILVEGEKKADVLQACLDGGAPGVYAVVSWPGGCKAWAKADWSWLACATVLAWPDCDSQREVASAKELNACADDAARDMLKASKPYKPAHKQPGMAAMLGIGNHLVADHGCRVQLLAIAAPGLQPHGWDAADAIESDGWDFERVLQFLGTAYALPSIDGGKKIVTPVGTQAGGSGNSGGSGGGGGGDAAAGGDDDGDGGQRPRPWWLACFYNIDKDRWNLSRKTIINALRYDERLAGVVGFNLLSNTMEARRDWPFEHAQKGDITNRIDLLLGNWLSKQYGLPAIARQAITEGIETVSYENPWHPIRDWLGGLVWDQKPRANTWLVHAIGETPESISPELFEYLSIVGRCLLVGMVKRVMEPGSKFDYCAVLEGRGGLRKSTFVKTLAGKDWYSDTAFDLGRGKEAQEQVQGVWLYELAEMANLGKADINSIKNFITAEVDRYRGAYAKVVEKHPRQCVMMGTTNDNSYLKDRTGNRRFWPIPVRHVIKIEWLDKYRPQLFAEAYQLYLAGETGIPSPADEERLFVPVQEARLIDTAVTSALLHALTRDPGKGVCGDTVNNLTDFVTIDMLCLALGADPGKASAGMQSEVRGWMNSQGWEYKKKQINGARGHGWVRPARWLLDDVEAVPVPVPVPTPLDPAADAHAGPSVPSADGEFDVDDYASF